MAKPTVLIVEDDPQVRKSMANVFLKLNRAFAATLAEARSQIAAHHHGLVVVVLDGDIEPDTTLELIDLLKGQSYNGLLVAHSANSALLRSMKQQGCTHAILKGSENFFTRMTAILEMHGLHLDILNTGKEP